MTDLGQRLGAELADRRDDLVALTQALVRIPTVNPPGEHYRDDLRADRRAGWRRRGFALEFVRAEGAPGDSDRYPRWNVVARREGGAAGAVRAFQLAISTWSRPATAGRVDPFGGELGDGRVYGRGACDMKGGLAASIVAAEAFIDVDPDFPGAIEISAHGRRGDRRLRRRRLSGAARAIFARRSTHVIIPEPLNKDRICLGHRGVWWAEIETHGRDRARLDAVPRRLRGAPHGRGARRDSRTSLFPALGGAADAMPVVPPAARGLDPEHQLASTAARPSRRRLRRLPAPGRARSAAGW